ncbi:hypothetical protein B0T26DRAFT_746094 [Lasiosphaeria miniovina]|uniref:Uncharacterized protein n=1 Tax=Lasiosphaeria miniovina TaxID=1954250 RepID=A0AA40BH57_9PEZI|nr:uncharacterized protein B0T26DRAFT_746094 [Lasiosphaeria miniovina]KAK0734143.1 hypothetical protein B0T26DRAFT_746094 [Lasiosphaeria miniovina]
MTNLLCSSLRQSRIWAPVAARILQTDRGQWKGEANLGGACDLVLSLPQASSRSEYDEHEEQLRVVLLAPADIGRAQTTHRTEQLCDLEGDSSYPALAFLFLDDDHCNDDDNDVNDMNNDNDVDRKEGKNGSGSGGPVAMESFMRLQIELMSRSNSSNMVPIIPLNSPNALGPTLETYLASFATQDRHQQSRPVTVDGARDLLPFCTADAAGPLRKHSVDVLSERSLSFRELLVNTERAMVDVDNGEDQTGRIGLRRGGKENMADFAAKMGIEPADAERFLSFWRYEFAI